MHSFVFLLPPTHTELAKLTLILFFMFISLQGGNSGSPVIHEETGHAIGVHTHGGCSSTGGNNKGTRIDRSEFKSHVDALLAVADDCTQDSDCDDSVFCNGAEVCNAGKCMSGAPPTCDDGLACTIDTCNEAARACEYQQKACSGPGESGVCIEPTGVCELEACPGSEKRIEVDILTDNYPAETTWSVIDKCGSNESIMSGGPYSSTARLTTFSDMLCVTAGQYDFRINVSESFVSALTSLFLLLHLTNFMTLCIPGLLG